MLKALEIPIQTWPSYQKISATFDQRGPLLRTVRVAWRDVPESVDAVQRTINECLCETGRYPHVLLLGWRTYLELSWFGTRDNFVPINEWNGVTIVCDPSKENFAKAIEDRALIDCSKGPFSWEK